MDSQKSMLHKDITYYFKYREFSGIFTVNDHISDNSIQINIKFTFTVCEYTVVYEYYEYILLSCFVYCNIVATHTHDGHTGFTFK